MFWIDNVDDFEYTDKTYVFKILILTQTKRNK